MRFSLWTASLLVEFLLLFIWMCKAEIDPFSDTVPNIIQWSGPVSTEPQESIDEKIAVSMVTSHNEKYICKFAKEDGDGNNDYKLKTYDGPSPESILKSFRSRISCSYRLESYWNYELCHVGKLRQYHEEKDPSTNSGARITQEYVLGEYNHDQIIDETGEVSTIQIDAEKYPYYMVHFTDGTVCDLTKAPRQTTVYYICHEAGRGEIHQVKETSTCEYSVIVFVAELCNHPLFRVNQKPASTISCYSLNDSPERPLAQQEIDNLLEKQTSRQSLQSASESSTDPPTSASPPRSKEDLEATRTPIGTSEDDHFIKQLLSGDYCIQGGSGWWLHEFCYGKTVHQFHVENGRRLTNILLGKWNREAHLQWLRDNPNKKA